MKILEINTEKTWRGGERQTYFALKGFRSLGHEVHLLAREGYSLIGKARDDKFECFGVDSHLSIIPFLLIHGRKYDILHFQTSSLLTFGVLTKLFHQSLVVYTRRLDFIPKGQLTKWKYNKADLIVSISSPISKILSDFGVNHTELITECIEEKDLNKSRALKFIDDHGLQGKKIIGTTAAFVQHKDPQTLVKAINELSKLRDDFVILHFGEGVLKPEIEGMIQGFNLDKFYKLPGFLSNVEDFFGIFDVFVMSSEEEGLGSSVLDAFIYKVPVVSTNAGGLSEIVKDRGHLVDVKDYKALANKLNRALESKSYSAFYVDHAYAFAKQRLNIETIHKEYIETFERLKQKKEQG